MTPPPATQADSLTLPVPVRTFGVRSAERSRVAVSDARFWRRLRLILDLMALSGATGAALLASPVLNSASPERGIAIGFPLVTLALLYIKRSPEERLSSSLLDMFVRVAGIVSASAMTTIAILSMTGTAHPGVLGLRLWLFSVVYVGGARAALLSVHRSMLRKGQIGVPTLIVGAGVVGDRLMRRLSTEPRYGLRPVGFLDADPLPRQTAPEEPFIPVMGGFADLEDAIRRTGARHVILSFSSEPDHVLAAKVRRCQELGVEVSLVPRLFELMNDRSTLDHVGGMPIVALRPTDPKSWQFVVKHMIDKALASASLLALAPALALIALAVKLSSPGPVLFRQQRVGRDGRAFTMLKFRTMRGDPSATGEADSGWAEQIRGGALPAPATSQVSARVTRVGRLLRATSLDELPQLFNVLRGDMSFVGPRPERVSYVRDFEQVVHRYGDRHRVKSGLTGWAQVNGLRGQTSIADRVEWDNYYIQNYSLRLDLRILALTVAEVCRFRG